MRFTKTLLSAISAVAFAAMLSVSCSEVEMYSVDAPDDLQSKIDSLANANSQASSGDTTYLTLGTVFVGEEGGGSGWWAEHSDYFDIPAGKKLVFQFYNYGTMENNWNNWNLAVVNCAANGTSEDSNYGEYFVIRSDAYGWGGSLSTYDGAMLKSNYGDTDEDGKVILDLDGDGDYWGDFRSEMYGALVTIEIDHSTAGYAYVTATAVTKSGLTLVETYEQEVSAVNDIYAFITTDSSWFKMLSAYLVPSEVTELTDYNATSISVTGQPTSIEVGNTNVWGSAVATVTFEDASSVVADSADVTISIDEAYLTTPGTYTVVYSYSKTKLGNYGTSVNGYYTIDVTNPIVALEVTTAPTLTTYYACGADVPFIKDGIVVTATYADGTTGVVSNDALTFGMVPGSAGSQNVTISYEGSSSTITTEYAVTVKQGTEAIGATDFSNGWWSTFTSSDTQIAAGASHTYKMMVYSDNLGNWHSPCTILRKADLSEYAVVRMDNFGWGDGYGTAVLESNWNWDTFMTSINGSMVDITITNNGDGTADIVYNVTYLTGEEHYQKYTGITVDSSDLQCALVTEESYLVLYE